MKQAIVQLLSWVKKTPKKKHTKILLGAGVFVLVGFLFSASAASANGVIESFGGSALASMTNNVVNAIILGFATVFSALTSLVLKLTMFCLRFFIELAGYNNYINAPAVIVGWFMVRDIANMLFIVGLLVIAFSTILGVEKYEWKKALGHLIVAAVLINFSRLILGWVIDISHVFMVAFLNAIQGAAGGNLIQMLNLDKMMSMSGGDLTFTGDNANAGESLRIELFAASFAGFMFSVLALLSIGAYAIVLLVRVLVLWMLIILSPLAFVLQAIPQAKSYVTDFWREFAKYVIVGPMAVFFLWLSFASLGNGDIGQHIGIKGQDAAQTAGIGASRSTQAVTLSEATRWDNLSAYFIAVGFLFLGLERVQKLGVKGGGLVGGAASFGGKVATIASGYAAGRWLTRKAGEKGVSAAKRQVAPVIGLAKWAKTRAPFVGDMARNKLARGIEDLGKERGGVLGGVGRVASWVATPISRMVETEGRSDKRAKDWLDFAETEQKRVEENYATGGSMAGKMKLDAKVRLKEVERRGEAKGKEKYAKKRQQLKDEQAGLASRAWARVTRQDAPKGKFAQELDEIAEFEAQATAADLRERQEKGYEAATGYRAVGNELAARAAEQKAAGEIVEETQKFFNNLNYNEKRAAGADVLHRLQQARTSGADNNQINDLRRQAVSALTAAMATDSETGSAAFRRMLHESGWTDPITDTNRMAAVATALTGRVVAPGGEEAAFREIEGSYDTEAARNQAMRTLSAAFKKTAGDGAHAFAGIVNEEEDDNRIVEYRFGTDFGAEARAAGRAPNRSQSEGAQTYFAERQNLTQITGAGDFGSSNMDGNLVHLSGGDIDRMATMFAGKNKNAISNLKPALIASLNNAGLDGNGNPTTWDPASVGRGIARAMRAMSDDDAREVFYEKLAGVIGRLGTHAPPPP